MLAGHSIFFWRMLILAALLIFVSRGWIMGLLVPARVRHAAFSLQPSSELVLVRRSDLDAFAEAARAQAFAKQALNDLKKYHDLFHEWLKSRPFLFGNENEYSRSLLYAIMDAAERRARYHPDDKPEMDQLIAACRRRLDGGPPTHDPSDSPSDGQTAEVIPFPSALRRAA